MNEILLTRERVAQWIPERNETSYKGDYGRALIIGGNQAMGGAVQMNAQAAVYAGCGLVTVASAGENRPALHAVLPEAMFIDWTDTTALEAAIKRSEIIAIGSGMAAGDRRYFEELMTVMPKADQLRAIVIDAGTIQWFKQAKETGNWPRLDSDIAVILTPHLGEWRQLTDGQVDASDTSSVQQVVDQLQAIIVLKQTQTCIYAPSTSDYFRNTAGNPGQAIGGMGDTLVGVIVAMLGAIAAPDLAAAAGVFLHSYAADRIYEQQAVVVPTQLAHELPRALKQLTMNK